MRKMRILAAVALCSAPALAQPDAGLLQIGTTTLQDFIEYIEWVFNTRLTQAERDEAKQLVEKAFAEKTADTLLVQESIVAKADLANHSEEDRVALRPSVEDEYVKICRMRYARTPLGKWLLSFSASVSKPLARGDVALTRHAADAYAEMLVFLANESGVGEGLADQAFRDGLATSLSADWKSYSAEEKAAVQAAPTTWAALREQYPSWPLDRKAKLKAEWQTALAALNGKPSGQVQPAVGSTDAGTTVPAKAVKLVPTDKALRGAAREMSGKIAGWMQ